MKLVVNIILTIYELFYILRTPSMINLNVVSRF